MAEQKPKKKKRRILKRIFKCIGLGLLVILLLLAIVFQAPWKVITLLFTVLAACTVFPKPALKWFWLSAAAIVLLLIIWVFLPDDNEGWQPYTFDEELAALQARYAIPDSENAAAIYNQLLENYDNNTYYDNLPGDEQTKLPMRDPWLSKDHPQLAEWVQQHQTTVATLTKASKFEKCQFPISLDTKPNSKWMKRLAVTRRWAHLLVTAANNDIAEGHINDALKKNVTLLRMAKHQRQQSPMMDTLVGVAIEALAIGELKKFIVTGDATRERLSIIEEPLAKIKHDWSSDFPKTLEYEKLSSKNRLGRFYEINPKGKIRLSRDPDAQMRAYWKKQLEADQIKELQTRDSMKLWVYPSYWQKKLIRARTVLHWFLLPSTPQKAARLIDTSYEKYYAIAKPDFNWRKEPEQIFPRFKFSYSYLIERLANMSEKSYYRLHALYLLAMREQRGSQILIALRRYKNENGNWPQTLDEVKRLAPAEAFIDPINGGAFVYKIAEQDFILYSKGENNIDEGGKRDRWGQEKTGADDWLIWPRRSRKTKEKDADAK